MSQPNWFTIIFLLAAFLVLLILSLQYPLSTSFPIGGDAAYYARRAQIFLEFFHAPGPSILALKSSWYPLSLLIFSSSAIIPLDWPIRFTWFMVIAHVSVGVSLALLLRRLSGWSAAAFAMFIWGITTTGVNSNFEDGTLAQLISFAFLALFLERFVAGAKWSALLWLLATCLAHPITGLSILVTLLIALPAFLSSWLSLSASDKKLLLVICGASLALLSLTLFTGRQIFSHSSFITGVADVPFINILVSSFAPFVALAPLGLLLLLRSDHSSTTKYIFAFLFSLSILMGGNDLLGIAVWTRRLLPLFIFVVTILSALSLPYLLRFLCPGRFTRAGFVSLIMVYFASMTWQNNHHIFRHYENPSNYARIHPEELEAMRWFRDNLPASSYITTSNKNRHTEWLPVITPFQWLPVSPDDDSLSHPVRDKFDSLTYYKYKYVAFLTRRENVPEYIRQSPDQYPLVFANKSVVLYKVSSIYD